MAFTKWQDQRQATHTCTLTEASRFMASRKEKKTKPINDPNKCSESMKQKEV